MYNKIIVGLSLEHGIAEAAIAAARNLANDDAQIIAVHVSEPVQESVRSFLSSADIEKARDSANAQLADRLKDHPGIEPVLLEGQPGRAMIDHAAEIKADCIVIGSHKPGLMDYLLGSTAARIVRHAPCSVHVLR